MPILGLHHVTATVDAAQDDLDFCLGGLGLRLVKKTVNFDNHHVYHFYTATPTHAGTIWTTPYKGSASGRRKGAGQVVVVLGAERVARLLARGSASTASPSPTSVAFGDRSFLRRPSGLTFELIAGARPSGAAARRASIGPRRFRPPASRWSSATQQTLDLMKLRFTAAGGRSRTRLRRQRRTEDTDVAQHADADGENRLGTVHHVAMAATEDEQLRLRGRLFATAAR